MRILLAIAFFTQTVVIAPAQKPAAPSAQPAGEVTIATRGNAIVSGKDWAYELMENHGSSPKIATLWRLNNERLLFTNEAWIVTGSFIALGLGRGKCELSFWDARSLALTNSLSLPNGVLHLDWSPRRKQFLAVTTCGNGDARWIKYPDDVAQALIAIDLERRQIERVALWQPRSHVFDYEGRCAPRWRGDEIIVPVHEARLKWKDKLSPLIGVAFSRPAFATVRVQFIDVSADDISFPLSSDAPDRAGLEYLSLRPPPTEQETSSSYDASRLQASSGRVTVGGAPGVHIVRPAFQGGIFDVDLSTLKHRLIKTAGTGFESVGIFADGVLRGVSQNELVLASPAGVVTRVPLLGRGEERSNLQIDFTDNAAFLAKALPGGRQPIAVTKIESSGRSIPEIVSLPNDFLSENFTRSPDFVIHADRHTIAAMLGDFTKEIFWKEFDWRTGKLASQPLKDEGGKAMFASERIYGSAPEAMLLTSTVAEKSTAGRSYAVTLSDLRTGKSLKIGDDPQRSFQPLVARLESSRTALVLSSGYVAAQLERVALSSGAVSPLGRWTWDSKDGRAFFESSKNWLFVPQLDGYQILELFSEHGFRKLADLYFQGDDQYALVLPNGHYAGSPGCDEMLKLKAGSGWQGAEGIAPWRNRPAEVLRALGGDAEQADILTKVTDRWLQRIKFDASMGEPKAGDLPEVAIPERPPLWARTNEVTIPIEVKAGHQALREVSVRVNGVLTAQFKGNDWQALPGGKAKKSIRVVLGEGQNWIEVNAVDASGRSGESQRFRTILKPQAKTPRRYLICLGVSRYAMQELDLQFAAKDARDMMNALQEAGRVDTQTLLLTDSEAVRGAVERIRSFVASSTESDEVILFCSGHGMLDESLDYVFAGHDFDPARPSQTGVKLDAFLDAVSAGKARKRLVLLDTCHAGLLGEKDEALLAQMDTKLPQNVRAVRTTPIKAPKPGGLSVQEQQRFIEEMFLLPGLKRGVSVIGASGGAQFALESDVWNNGVFTASVIEALRDRKADWNQDGRITVSELKSYVSQRVPELTGNAQKPSVVAFERDQDFTLRK